MEARVAQWYISLWLWHLIIVKLCFVYLFINKERIKNVRALASHQCGPGLNPGADAIFGLSLSLALSLAPRG